MKEFSQEAWTVALVLIVGAAVVHWLSGWYFVIYAIAVLMGFESISGFMPSSILPSRKRSRRREL